VKLAIKVRPAALRPGGRGLRPVRSNTDLSERAATSVHPTRLRGFRQGQSPGFGLDAGRGASSPSGEATSELTVRSEDRENSINT
jgi:hypothetical protein